MPKSSKLTSLPKGCQNANDILKNGEILDQYPVDRSQDEPNAGNGYVVKCGGKAFEVIEWYDTDKMSFKKIKLEK